ncbi:MAG: GNAT family N-acetyltransferase [Acidimicrobiales bacterium]
MSEVHVLRTEHMAPHLLAEIRALLLACFEGDFSNEDWEHALGGWHVVVVDGAPVGHAAVIERMIEIGGRNLRAGYVEGVASAPARQGEGLGSTVMEHIGQLLHTCFEIGVLSTGAHAFYERLGWERWQGPTFVRDGLEVTRTPDEDDGIMVLRYGTEVDLNCALPISCETRPGDDW